MGNMRGTEQDVASTNCGYRFLDSIMAASGGDEIEFIALMRDLRSVGGAGGESDLKITVNEHFRMIALVSVAERARRRATLGVACDPWFSRSRQRK